MKTNNMKVIVRKSSSISTEGKFVAKRSMSSFTNGVIRSVTVKSHARDSYSVKAKVIK